MSEKMIEFSILCPKCDNKLEATVEMAVLSEIACPECFECYDVTVIVEPKT